MLQEVNLAMFWVVKECGRNYANEQSITPMEADEVILRGEQLYQNWKE